MEEIIVDKRENQYIICVLEDNDLVEKHILDSQNMPKIGNIYLCKVKDIDKALKMIFVDFGDDINGFIAYSGAENVKPGDKLITRLVKEKKNKKGAKLTLTLPEFEESVRKRILKEAENKEKGLLYDFNTIEDIVVRDYYDANRVAKIWVNCDEIYEKINEKLALKSNLGVVCIKNVESLIDEFGLFSQFERAENAKVWLKSGGQIVIDKTEAMYVIDVNSTKASNSKVNKEELVYRINKESATEVMKQLRLKDLRGIIVVDFINMKYQEHRYQIVELMKNLALKDRRKVNIFGFTRLGLLEITRT